MSATGKYGDPNSPRRRHGRRVSFALVEGDIPLESETEPEPAPEEIGKPQLFLLFATLLAIVAFWLRADYALAGAHQTPVVCHIYVPRPDSWLGSWLGFERCSEGNGQDSVEWVSERERVEEGDLGEDGDERGYENELYFVDVLKRMYRLRAENAGLSTELAVFDHSLGDNLAAHWMVAAKRANKKKPKFEGLIHFFHSKREHVLSILSSQKAATESHYLNEHLLALTEKIIADSDLLGYVSSRSSSSVWSSRSGRKRSGPHFETDLAAELHRVFSRAEWDMQLLRNRTESALKSVEIMDALLNVLAHPDQKFAVVDLERLKDEDFYRSKLRVFMKESQVENVDVGEVVRYVGNVKRTQEALKGWRGLLDEYDASTKGLRVGKGTVVRKGRNVDEEVGRWAKGARMVVRECKESHKQMMVLEKENEKKAKELADRLKESRGDLWGLARPQYSFKS